MRVLSVANRKVAINRLVPLRLGAGNIAGQDSKQQNLRLRQTPLEIGDDGVDAGLRLFRRLIKTLCGVVGPD